jgi:hypothetical protein
MFMKTRFLILMAVFFAGVSAETVSKNSAPFPFPTTVGAKGFVSFQNKDISFSFKVHSGNRTIIGLSWSLPEKTQKGTISIFTLAGTKIKTFSITGQQGNVNWDLSPGTKLANGVYLATMTSGTYKKNLQILLSR